MEYLDWGSLEKKFGNNLRHRLENNELTQTEIANALDASQPVISRYINGRSVPDFITALKIANYFKLNLYEFLDMPTPNAVKENSSFHKFLRELRDLINKYVSPRYDFVNTKAKQPNDRITKFVVTYEYSAKNMYPLANDSNQQGTYTVCDSYLIINDNIYPERHFDMLWSYENEHLSFFEYVNNILAHDENSSCLDERYDKLKRMMNVFTKNRHLFGVLGTLSSSKFFWLVYLMAYESKFVAYPTE